MPYGLGLAKWDVLVSDLELATFFIQLAAINRAQAHCLVLSVAWHDMGRVRAAMLENGYSDAHALFNYKPQNNTSGMEFISAVETLVVAYKGGIKACHLTFPELNPVYRHNLLFGHQVGPKRKYTGEEAEVNPTQKNPNFASALGRIVCPPGANALVLGAGSGSEVLGLARVGVNVVGIERDAKQFRALTERVSTEAAVPAAALEQLAEDDQQIKVLKRLAANFTKLNPDINSHFTADDEAVGAASADDEAEKLQDADSAAAAALVCPACGQVVSRLEVVSCDKSGCEARTMHPACRQACSKCTKRVCSADCLQAHGCSHQP